MSCGFGAVMLVFLIIDHSLVEIRTVNAEVLSEVELLEEDIREGEAGLVQLRNALTRPIWTLSRRAVVRAALPRSSTSTRR